MQAELSQLKRYVHETLGISISPNPWAGSSHLPFFLRDRYAFFEVTFLDASCLVMLDRDEQEQSPAVVRKHMYRVKDKWGGEIVYMRRRITAYNRKRLIEHKLPFVVPGNQMYLPWLGIDLREHFRKLRKVAIKFRPSTQGLVLQALLRGTVERTITPAEMAQCLGYSAMTMTRAFDELESADLVEVISEGRERHLRFIASAKDVWIEARPFLRSPVKNRFFINQMNLKPPGPRAGLSALAHYSMLAEPANPVFALSREDWESLRQHREAEILPHKEPGAIEIEVWSYAPTLFAENGLVDRLSLYLSFEESKDERVEAALEEMMRGQRW